MKYNVSKNGMSINFVDSITGEKFDYVKFADSLYNGEKFQVLEGSQVNIDKPAQLQKYNIQRQELLSKQSIVNIDGKYILKITLEFKTPSGAGAFILGGSINGWAEWKTKDGKTLDEVYRKSVQ